MCRPIPNRVSTEGAEGDGRRAVRIVELVVSAEEEGAAVLAVIRDGGVGALEGKHVGD